MKKLIVALVGKAGSGKDTILKALCEKYPEYNMIVSCTTRPKREGEADGVNYHFLTGEQFARKVLNGDMLEATSFNGWHYGTSISALKDGVNIGVFNPEGYDCLSESSHYMHDTQVIGYHVMCRDKTRLLRQLNRENDPDVDEIIRRWSTDEIDFAGVGENVTLFPLWNETKQDLVQEVDLVASHIQHLVDLGHE